MLHLLRARLPIGPYSVSKVKILKFLLVNKLGLLDRVAPHSTPPPPPQPHRLDGMLVHRR